MLATEYKLLINHKDTRSVILNNKKKNKYKLKCKYFFLYIFFIFGIFSFIFLCVSFGIYINNINFQTKLSYSKNNSMNDITISWNTLGNYKKNYVSLYDNNKIIKIPAKTKIFKSLLFNRYTHSAKIHLNYNKTYKYIVNNDNLKSNKFNLKINKKKNFKILFYGDMGIYDNNFLDFIFNEVKTEEYDFILHLGDIAYDLNSCFGFIGDLYLSQMEKITSIIPYMTICGNHESYKNFTNYKGRFIMPNSDKYENLFYSLNFPPLKIINLNTESYYYKSLNNTIINQDNFINKELENINRTKFPWVIITGHRPMYCSNLDSDDCNNWKREKLRTILEDKFLKSNVSIYLSAHEHNYERICPIYNGKCSNILDNYTYNKKDLINPIHIISGSAGNIEGLTNFKKKVPSWSITRKRAIGFGSLEIDSNKLSWKAYILEKNEKILTDNFTIFRNN